MTACAFLTGQFKRGNHSIEQGSRKTKGLRCGWIYEGDGGPWRVQTLRECVGGKRIARSLA